MELKVNKEITCKIRDLRQTNMSLSIIFEVDCKTVRIFAYSSMRKQSNNRSGTRLKTESV